MPRSFLISLGVMESLTWILSPPNLKPVMTEKSWGVNITSPMPEKWKVYVVSQKHSNKTRTNWRSFYSWVFWFNKASKKVPKPTSLMIFLIFGDNASHMPFNIWRLPWHLRFCNTNLAHHQDAKNSHAKKNLILYQQKFLMTKNHTSKKINVPPKFYHDQQPQKFQCPK